MGKESGRGETGQTEVGAAVKLATLEEGRVTSSAWEISGKDKVLYIIHSHMRASRALHPFFLYPL